MSYKSITLCYTEPKQFERKWTCEMGYQSISEADKRAFQLTKQNNLLITKLYPQSINNYELTQKMSITYDLSKLVIPTVNMRQKPIYKKDDKHSY